MKYVIADGVIKLFQLESNRVFSIDIYKYFPRYLIDKPSLECGWFKYWCLQFIQFLICSGIKLFLCPRKGEVGNLSREEVASVYDREANTYDGKHHLTTHGADINWRRKAAAAVVTIGRLRTSQNRSDVFNVLDLCTGTGLTVCEILRQLAIWNIPAEVIGLDYNQKMLQHAQNRKLVDCNIKTIFVRGDAMDLYSDLSSSQTSDLIQFPAGTFDIITQMFGIGGINNPIRVFEGVINILKPEGQFFLIDMHMPIVEQAGEMFLFKWFKFPSLEMMTYWKTTVPLALSRLWGWRDSTLDFYLLPLITCQDAQGVLWGFEVVNFEVESQIWWLGLPIMPVGSIVVKKIEITLEEMNKRQALLLMVIA
ncbi:MAG: hypothetical protein A3B89_04880 [Candidatus Buchananbacteria bacterium RIFCSPHIGHO2_02_FULL_40_13]|uniref:Methyltransferase domain-containing protein n=1 Tax=Candidatus Buchananbacteria bacterium RIFCSPLOWO2_01_FULL_39_33 TaxID=1797543 RepID=A0A1G1YK44_9BACT|nr:MAG: hypothetical protein A2820_00205 [Candidatus Buchananbacteria bacterium RIFCSPHIGHO2_01_FULL_40_35]OGY49776.1 MAG: hypothetical protein A3B89_04880 [Candidatus Buchananbacteria bacterium RIFCSPHIGHO2_02_FULL_40_13]OGY52722.1 MAG: hypothetical protein A3A02_02695 [Candidatus Buchananbacteria bacterium RIFCSPLOWO2_01_FULL_39_33]